MALLTVLGTALILALDRRILAVDIDLDGAIVLGRGGLPADVRDATACDGEALRLRPRTHGTQDYRVLPPRRGTCSTPGSDNRRVPPATISSAPRGPAYCCARNNLWSEGP